jgi:hypothetical protein
MVGTKKEGVIPRKRESICFSSNKDTTWIAVRTGMAAFLIAPVGLRCRHYC